VLFERARAESAEWQAGRMVAVHSQRLQASATAVSDIDQRIGAAVRSAVRPLPPMQCAFLGAHSPVVEVARMVFLRSLMQREQQALRRSTGQCLVAWRLRVGANSSLRAMQKKCSAILLRTHEQFRGVGFVWCLSMIFKRQCDASLVRTVARWRIRQIAAWTKQLLERMQRAKGGQLQRAAANNQAASSNNNAKPRTPFREGVL